MATDRTAPRDDAVTDLSPVFKLIKEPKFADLYAQLRAGPATIPELLPDLSIEKSTAYKYIDFLQQGGLVTEIGTVDGSTQYRAEEFQVTIRIAETELTVTPEFARVIARREDNPEVDRFIDQYGIVTLAEFIPLAQQYAAGEMTHRAIAEILDVSRAAAFEMLREVLDILEIVPDSDHTEPGDYSEKEVEQMIENARSSN
jgi:predicted transcriptional regulator